MEELFPAFQEAKVWRMEENPVVSNKPDPANKIKTFVGSGNEGQRNKVNQGSGINRTYATCPAICNGSLARPVSMA